jgi:HEAT repeat protein
MNVNARQQDAAAPLEAIPGQGSAVKAASAVLNQFARTLKTCRLYDANNPAVIRFREEFVSGLRKVLNEHGAVAYRFASDDVFFDDVSLYPARSRDDNLALAFYRDGIRTLTINPGVEAREIDALIDAVLQVTGQNHGEDDLVTLLWEAQLSHIDIDYVPGEGDPGSGGGGDLQGSGPILPWPSFAESGEAPPEDDASTRTEGVAVSVSRSEDWTTGDLTVEIEAGFEELDALAPGEVQRFRKEFDAEHAVPTVTATLAISYAFLAAGANADDRQEIARFLPRVLRQSVTHGAWVEAREALVLLRDSHAPDWSLETFAQELLQPISISSAVERVDQQEPGQVTAFVELAKELGGPAVDWLNLVLAESQNRRTRRIIAEAIAGLCRDNPERLAPWLSDPRWFVVRNIVHILGWIGGNSIVGLLQGALRHPEPRVRQEVVAALSQVDPRLARPLLVRLLDGADTRMFCSVMHQLSAVRDSSTARFLVTVMQGAEFDQRALEEKRALYGALGGSGGDEVLADLEAELHKGNWFSRHQEVHRQAVARIIARIGTPAARVVLERGVQSRRQPVRKACEDALGGMVHRE